MSRQLLLLLAAAAVAWYMVPRMIEAGMNGYRKGAEIRQSQGR